MTRGPARFVDRATRFDADYERCLARRENITRLDLIIDLLARGKRLPPGFDPHRVYKDFPGMLEGHVEPDFLLVYKLERFALRLHRCGKHAELFPRSKSARRA